MATVIDLRDTTVARLKARMAAVEEDNSDLLAFARGHAGAVSAIHEATLAVLGATTFDALTITVARDWPGLLGVDAVALMLLDERAGALLAHSEGLAPIDRSWARRTISGAAAVRLVSVGRGHPVFGASATAIRGQALIRLDDAANAPIGLLALGQTQPLGFEKPAGTELLVFLGRVLSGMIARCTTD